VVHEQGFNAKPLALALHPSYGQTRQEIMLTDAYQYTDIDIVLCPWATGWFRSAREIKREIPTVM
jgi:hypothetical protein